MKPGLCLLLLALAMAGTLHAEVPQKAPLTKYQKLWQFSPFTARPVGTTGPVYNPLEDYVLLGVSPIKEGYRVTLLNKKNPAEKRIVVESHKPAKGFEVLGVIRQKGNPRGTVVRLMRQGTTGTVGFEEKFLTLAPPPAADKAAEPPANLDAAKKPPIAPKIPRAPVVQPPGGSNPSAGASPARSPERRPERRFNR